MAQITLNSTGVASNGALVLQSNGTTTAITINSSQGVEFNAGTAALPAITTTGDTNTGIFFPAADTIAFSEGGAEAMRIDSSGNLGLGVTPSAWGTYSGIIDLKGNGSVAAFNQSVLMAANAYYNGTNFIYKATTSAGYYQIAGNQFQWYNAASGTAGNTISFTQAMTLDASGNLLVGKTTDSNTSTGISLRGVGEARFSVVGTGTNTTIAFFRNGSASESGRIDTTSTTTSYVTSSDYRLKNSIAPMTGALAKVAALKPCTYKWNENDSEGEGFIAHELAEICPYAVTGEKDAVDADGNPKYQGIDTSFLVATLTAAIKEQQALITTLTARISALEA